jgi:hypothetical protein
MLVSSKVLVDIPFFGQPTGKEKIIFQRERTFSLETISLLFKKLFIGKQMKQAAADRIQALCQNYGYKEKNIQELDKHINATNSVETEQVIKTFSALSKENRRTIFLEEKGNNAALDLPDELNTLISNELELEAKTEYYYYLQNSKFKKETLIDVLSLARNADGSENDEINSYILHHFYHDETMDKTPEELSKLNENASIMLVGIAQKIKEKENDDKSNYAVLVKSCLDEIAIKLCDSNKIYPTKNKILENWKKLKSNTLGI